MFGGKLLLTFFIQRLQTFFLFLSRFYVFLFWGNVFFIYAKNHIVHLVSVFILAGISRSVAALTSVHCARVSELLQNLLLLLVVHPLSENPVLNCPALCPLK